jgi:two-component system cell cycle response regulator DivK
VHETSAASSVQLDRRVSRMGQQAYGVLTYPRAVSFDPNPVHAPQQRPKQSLLIVEDEVDVREMMTLYLGFCGYAVQGAADGVEAIELASRTHPDLILMDLMMPRMDGWEATRRLKASALTGDIPIIALSARSRSDEDHSARRAGCDGFIGKPCSLDQLAATLHNYLDGYDIAGVRPVSRYPRQ